MSFFESLKRPMKGVVYRFLTIEACVNFKLRSLEAADALLILNLHRVNSPATGGYGSLDAAVFDELLGWLASRFQIVLFDELRLQAEGRKPRLILSFDDGYKDFLEVAAPILEKRHIRVNHNIVPSCIESGRPPMSVELQEFIVQAPALLLRETPLPGLPSGADPDRRGSSCLRASAVFKKKTIAEQKTIFRELERAFARFDKFRPTAMMTLGDIRELAGTHEFGAHSFEHASMAVETEEYLSEDTRKCRAYFSENLGFHPKIYAFPNGSMRAGQAEQVRASGFEAVLEVGENYSRSSSWLHQRFTIRGETISEARARALGWFSQRVGPSR